MLSDENEALSSDGSKFGIYSIDRCSIALDVMIAQPSAPFMYPLSYIRHADSLQMLTEFPSQMQIIPHCLSGHLCLNPKTARAAIEQIGRVDCWR